jgi:uncharacterized protein YodC (DUF2158 family)
MSFKIGDQVQLKGGGPCMTVIGTLQGGNLACCCWFDGKGLQEVPFPNDTLTSCEALDENARMLQEILDLNRL